MLFVLDKNMTQDIPSTDMSEITNPTSVGSVTVTETPAIDFTTVLAIATMIGIGILAIILLEIFRPGDNTATIAAIIGILTPTTLSLLAFLKAQQTHVLVNSRMTEFMNTLTQLSQSQVTAAKAQGIVQGKAQGAADANLRTDILANQMPTTLPTN